MFDGWSTPNWIGLYGAVLATVIGVYNAWDGWHRRNWSRRERIPKIDLFVVEGSGIAARCVELTIENNQDAPVYVDSIRPWRKGHLHIRTSGGDWSDPFVSDLSELEPFTGTPKEFRERLEPMSSGNQRDRPEDRRARGRWRWYVPVQDDAQPLEVGVIVRLSREHPARETFTEIRRTNVTQD